MYHSTSLDWTNFVVKIKKAKHQINNFITSLYIIVCWYLVTFMCTALQLYNLINSIEIKNQLARKKTNETAFNFWWIQFTVAFVKMFYILTTSELPIPKLWDLNPDPDLCSQIGSKSRSLPQGWDLNPDPIFSDPDPTD